MTTTRIRLTVAVFAAGFLWATLPGADATYDKPPTTTTTEAPTTTTEPPPPSTTTEAPTATTVPAPPSTEPPTTTEAAPATTIPPLLQFCHDWYEWDEYEELCDDPLAVTTPTLPTVIEATAASSVTVTPRYTG
jgi:hypothetical protein